MNRLGERHGKNSGGRIVPASGIALVLLCTLCTAPMAYAGSPMLPSGGTVVAGSAAILQSGPAGTTIVQQSKSAVINWQSFSVGAGAAVTFQQPDSASIALNRVTGPEASAVNGSLLANGQVWLINRNGVLFGQGSQINVGGLIATTSDMKDSDFLSGHYVFAVPSNNPDAAVINQGSIKAATGGSVLLSAGRVSNEGLIQARLGHVVLGGADAFSVAFDGDNLLQYQISAPVSQPPKDAQGSPAALVSNSGSISAQGGSVLMTARAARGVVDNVINSTGLIQANSASIQNGEVVLDAGEDGHVAVSGTIDVSGPNAGESGGTIAIRGNSVAVADGARLEASGDAGGGTVVIGGNLHDGGADPVAQSVVLGKSVIAANATASGKGGTVTIASNGLTGVAASISAKGVTAGGMVETSGQQLNVTSDAHIDTSASAGAGGMWLLDPVNVDVDPALASNIVGNLNSTNVTISASNDITVNAPVVYTSTNTLSFLAGHNLIFNADVQNFDAPGAIFAIAGWDGLTAAANILSTPNSYGRNGGSVLIGGNGAGAGVAMGSRNGTTTVAASGLSLSAVNGYAQLGYHGSPNAGNTRGDITVALTGGLSLTGGAASGFFAQIGHGRIGAAANQAGDIAITALGPVVLAGGSAAQSYALIGNGGAGNSGHNSGTVRVISSGNVVLGAGASLQAAGPGDALVIAAATGFTNQAGGAALDVSGGGRWLVFLQDSGANAPGGLSAAPFYNRAFDYAANSYAPVTSAGNRFVYAIAPQLTVTATSQTKFYGDANPALTATISGGLPGDALAGVFTGTPGLSTTATVSSGVGNYAIVASLGTLSSDFNYGFQFVNGTLHIDPAMVTPTLTGVQAFLTGLVQKVYDGTALATLTAANYQLSGVLPGDSVALNNPVSGTYSDKNVGSGKTVSVSGLVLTGVDKGNYVLSSSSISGPVGRIDPAALTVSLTGSVQKVYDGTNFATLDAGNYQLSGIVSGDNVILNSPLAGFYNDKNVGSGKTVSVSGLVLTGVDKGNYSLSSSASAPIGTIVPAVVSASLTGMVQKIFDATTAAALDPSNYNLAGLFPGDLVNLNNPVAGSYDTAVSGAGKVVTVSGLALSGPDSGDYVLASQVIAGAIGIIVGGQSTSTTSFSGQVRPAGGSGTQTASDATSDTGGAQGDAAQTDGAAAALGKSLGGGAQSSSSVLIDGLLRQFSATPGNSNPHGVPPYGQVYSSWGNEAFWQ